MPEHVRRSSRIPKELTIFIVGSDMEGKVFTERTKTVVLSRHGAGIISEFPLSAEQELIIRRDGSTKEAEVRVVGQLGAVEGGHLYGVAFLDPNLEFWGIEFPPLTDAEKQGERKVLECVSCKGREVVHQSDVEADVFTINQGLVRYCQKCGMSTIWKLALGDVETGPEPSTTQENAQAAPQLVPADIPQPANAPSSVTLEPVAPPDTAQAPPPLEPVPVSAAAPPGAPPRKENRRKHVRTRVNFKACVRYQNYPDDVVACEDMSRGGLRFKSNRRYPEKANIEVAAPYEPGSPAIFVSAQIVHAQELPGGKSYRYGVAYMRNR